MTLDTSVTLATRFPVGWNALDVGRRTIRCTEVWGGNMPVNESVSLPGLDAWIVSQPSGGANAGSNVHFMSACAGGRTVRALVADVSGHGEGAAATALSLRGLMRELVNDRDQSRFVGELNQRFTSTLAGLGTSKYRFATAVALTLDTDTGKLLVCNAGHPPPLWYQSFERRWVNVEPVIFSDKWVRG